ncbi:MAG TPA: transposase [Pseudolabrys sp.]|nr:transposase [Pseudolabrys sp.]
MARIGRIVIPGLPHHVTQRGNRRERVFFESGDFALYRDLLAERCAKAGVEVWCYCLMPNHVHLILVPHIADGLSRALGETHRRYTAFINARARWTGHLFQGRYGSATMDETHLIAAARYIALNPVRARLVGRPQDWAWSSARAHLSGRDDELVKVRPLLDRVGQALDLIGIEPDAAMLAALRGAGRTGRPLGSDDFVAGLEQRLRRSLRPGKRGRKPPRVTAPSEPRPLFADVNSAIDKVSPQ